MQCYVIYGMQYFVLSRVQYPLAFLQDMYWTCKNGKKKNVNDPDYNFVGTCMSLYISVAIVYLWNIMHLKET